MPPSTSLAPWVSFEMSILRTFLSGDADGPSQSSLRCETDTTGSARLLSPQVGNCLPPGVAPCGRGARARAPRPPALPGRQARAGSPGAAGASTASATMPIDGDERHRSTTACSSAGRRAGATRTRRGASSPASDSPTRAASAVPSTRSSARSPTSSRRCATGQRGASRRHRARSRPDRKGLSGGAPQFADGSGLLPKARTSPRGLAALPPAITVVGRSAQIARAGPEPVGRGRSLSSPRVRAEAARGQVGEPPSPNGSSAQCPTEDCHAHPATNPRLALSMLEAISTVVHHHTPSSDPQLAPVPSSPFSSGGRRRLAPGLRRACGPTSGEKGTPTAGPARDDSARGRWNLPDTAIDFSPGFSVVPERGSGPVAGWSTTDGRCSRRWRLQTRRSPRRGRSR